MGAGVEGGGLGWWFSVVKPFFKIENPLQLDLSVYVTMCACLYVYLFVCMLQSQGILLILIPISIYRFLLFRETNLSPTFLFK